MKKDRTLPQLLAVVIINDLIPRLKKNNNQYPPADFFKILVQLEYEQLIDRKKLREFLDQYYDDLREGRCKPWSIKDKPTELTKEQFETAWKELTCDICS